MASNFTIDADGRVHYADGSISAPRTTWTDTTGRTVYSQNSAGPASTAGGAYVYAGGAVPNTQSGNQTMYDGSVTPVTNANTPYVGTPALGAAPVAPTPAPSTGGAVWGGTSPSKPSSPQTSLPPAVGGILGSATSTSSGGSVDRNVNAPLETIEGRLGNLLGMDASGNYTNGVIRQASENAMAQFAGRGLLNSSMATEAATQAAMSKAIEIAGPDAQTYFSQGRANQDAANVFKRDDKGYAQESIVLDKNQALDREKMAQAGSQFNQELAFKYEALKLDKNSQTEATSLAHKYSLEMNNIKAVDSSFDLYLRRISEIDNNKDLTADTKAQMKNSAGKDFDLYAKAKGIVYEQQFGGRYETKEKPGAAPPSEPPVSGGLGGDGGILGSAKR